MSNMPSPEFHQDQQHLEKQSSGNYLQAAGKAVKDRLGRVAPTIKQMDLRNILLRVSLLGITLFPSDYMQSLIIHDSKTPISASSSPPAGLSTEASTSPSSTLETPRPEDRHFFFGNTKVAIDKNGLPIEYVLPDGKRVSFDKDELLKLREKAIATKELEVITVIPLGKYSNESESLKYSVEHPVTSELPKDILPDKELEKIGVRIIQADNTTLSIRKSAFDKDGLLADFNNTGRKLTIVLVDAPFLARHFLQDPKYDSIRGYFPEIDNSTIDEYKGKIISFLEYDLEVHRQEREETPEKFLAIDADIAYRKEILHLKIELFRHQKVLTDQQLLEASWGKISVTEQSEANYFMGSGGGITTYHNGDESTTTMDFDSGSVITEHAGQDSITKIRDPFNNPTVVIAVGKTVREKYFGVFFDQDGKTRAISMEYSPRTPMLDQTYPNPSDFSFDPQASYPYASKAPGFTLRHETMHDVLIAQQLNKGDEPNYSEFDTDMGAMESIKKAWETWRDSGFKDNSEFYFVFSLPGGGYILTDNQSSPDLTAPKKL